MDAQLRLNHQTIINRFIRTCESDDGIVAAFLVGSYVKGTPDEHSDLDLYLITKDEAHDDFVSKLVSFVHQLGEPLFMEDFGLPGIVFLIFPDGTEVELSFIREGQINLISNEPFEVLLDKKNISASVVHEKQNMDQTEQTEKLRRLIYWFWHEVSHLVTALGRGQLWWAQGQLESIRSMCMGLARLQYNFLDADVTGEVYFKIEKEIPKDRLSPLQVTFPPMEKDAILKAGLTLVKFYKKHAMPLAQEHGIAYPERLEKIMVERLKKISK